MQHGKVPIRLDGVSETLLGPLRDRAKLSKEHSSLFYDSKAIELVEKIDYDCNKSIYGLNVLRAKQFDDKIKAYIKSHPYASIVNIGAGLDTTFYRVDNGLIHWYDLDLPAVIDIRRQLLPEPDRVMYIAQSLFDPGWCKDVKHTEDGVFMIAGGVLPYFEESQVKHFFLSLADNLPGAEIVFDVTSQLTAIVMSLNAWRMEIEEAQVKWAVKDANEMIQWDTRIRVIEQFPYFRGVPRDPAWGEEIKIWMDFMDEIKICNIFHVSV